MYERLSMTPVICDDAETATALSSLLTPSKNIGISLNNVSLLSTAKLNAASSPTIIASYGSTSPR